MKIVRTEEGYGIIDGAMIELIEGEPFEKPLKRTGKKLEYGRTQLLAPVPFSKAVCIGLNYRDHAEEFGLPIPETPVVFLKPSTAATGCGSDIIYPDMCHRLDYEAELAGYSEEELSMLREMVRQQVASAGTSAGSSSLASSEALNIAMGDQLMGIGTINGMETDFNLLATLADQEEGIDYTLLPGQVGKSFLPEASVGILESSVENNRVTDFFCYLFGREFQELDLPDGLPVNQAAFVNETTAREKFQLPPVLHRKRVYYHVTLAALVSLNRVYRHSLELFHAVTLYLLADNGYLVTVRNDYTHAALWREAVAQHKSYTMQDVGHGGCLVGVYLVRNVRTAAHP